MWNKIQRIYLGTNLVRPTIKWQLYKETDFKSSSWWTFRVDWWNTNNSPSNIGFNTTDGYIYSTNSHSQARIHGVTSDFSSLSNAKAVKIVCDWIYRGNNTNSYNTAVWIWCINFNKNSGENSVSGWTLLTWSLPDLSTWYTAEFIIKKWEYWILTVSNGSTYQSTYDWDYLMSTASWGWFYNWQTQNFGYISKNQWTGCQMKDIHVYIWI